MMLELINNSAYIREAQHLENHNLALSTEKTKEIMADFTEEVVRVTNLKKILVVTVTGRMFLPKNERKSLLYFHTSICCCYVAWLD